MKKIAFFLTILTIFSILSILPVSADSAYTIEVTDGKSSALTDRTGHSHWTPSSADSKVTLTLKSGRTTDGIYISWYSASSVFTITAKDSGGNIVTSYKNTDRYDGYSCFYALDERTRTVEIAMPSKSDGSNGITYLALSEKGVDDPDMMKWADPGTKCNLLVVATHQDDEYIFLGGVIPKYIDAGYSVALAYTANCGRWRIEEGLNGIWESGIRSYPDFMDFPDKGRKESFDEAADVWGGLDAVVLSYVRELRVRKPEVVVSHDENGENYHNSHKVTAAALKKAVELAADPSYDPESAGKYGVWQVSKLYLHLYKKNQISLDYHTPLASYGGKTAYEVATDAYEWHKSQHGSYKLDWSAIATGAKYDNSLFGCCFSTVGFDSVDLFYGTSVYRGDSSNPPADPPASSTEEQPSQTTPQTTSTAPDPAGTAEGAGSTSETSPEATPTTTPEGTDPQISTAPSEKPNTAAPVTGESGQNDGSEKTDPLFIVILLLCVAALAVGAGLIAFIILKKQI